MDKLFQNAMQQAQASKKQTDSTPWTPDSPHPQPFYAWIDETKQWLPATPSTTQRYDSRISKIALYSWNIDFMLPFPETRMAAALSHLQDLTHQTLSSSSPDTAVMIHLQECLSSDLVLISQVPWIRDAFYITDIDTSAWSSRLYGTTTLIDRRLAVSSVFRVHFSLTRMERDALFVDVLLSSSGPGENPGKKKKLRLCTSHLESLALDPPLRPAQMKLIASHMHAHDVSGAVVMGDFNAIQPFDLFLHTENGLKDAYLELGGKENAEEGYTWGQQALPEQRKRFGCSRMDKAFYCGGLKVLGFERFGAGVLVPEHEREKREELLALGFERPWVTDHLGVKVVFDLRDDSRL